MARIPGTIIAGTSATNASGETEWSVATTGGSGGGGTDPRVAQNSDASTQTGLVIQGAVRSGNQGYTVGTTQVLNMEPGGRLKVAVSYVANIVPAAKTVSNDAAALMGAIYNTTRPTFSDGFTGALQASRIGSLSVLSETLFPSAGSNLSGTATTTSTSAFAANANRRPGDIQGQNVSATATLYINEFNGTAAANTAGTYMVPPGGTFSITTNQQVNMAASASCPYTATSI